MDVLQELKLEDERRAKEYAELSEVLRRQSLSNCNHIALLLFQCTFSPVINRRRSGSGKSGPVVVRGLGRHLELKGLAARKAEEQRERENKAFLKEVEGGSQRQYTIPQV